jgi:hypothetical protein
MKTEEKSPENMMIETPVIESMKQETENKVESEVLDNSLKVEENTNTESNNSLETPKETSFLNKFSLKNYLIPNTFAADST